MRTCILTIITLACQIAFADNLKLLGVVKFQDAIEDEAISGVAVFEEGNFVVIGVDEGTRIQVLKRTDDNEYSAHKTINLIDIETKDEIDIEGIARDNRTFYIVGSHSRKRSKVKPDEKTQEQNRSRLEENESEPLRDGLYRLKLNKRGELDSEIESTNLRRRISEDTILNVFSQIPSKENGVDIEGIATKDHHLYLGFRGPVLRGGYVPILKFDFDEPNKAETLFVDLDGRGIRDMCRVNDGFLLIGGPVGDEPVSYELYFWDGEDGVPGKDVTTSKPQSLGRIPASGKDAKAEGITVFEETDTHIDVLIVYDGVANGDAKLFRVKRR